MKLLGDPNAKPCQKWQQNQPKLQKAAISLHDLHKFVFTYEGYSVLVFE